MHGYYSYNSSNNTLYMDERILRFLTAVLLMGLVFVLLIGLIFYAFRSIGLHRIAKRRGIRHAWLAWLPMGSAWITGSISDQYQYVVKGRINNRRIILLLLSAAVTLLSIMAAALSVDVLAAWVGQTMFGTNRMDPVRLIAFMSATAVESVVALAYMVFRYFSVYDLYASCTSRYRVLYLVLGILFNFLEPFFLFACRDKDEGMPPRRETAVQYEEPVCQPPEQAWTEE